MQLKSRIRYQIKWTTKENQKIMNQEELKSLLSKIRKELKIKIISLEITNRAVLLEISSPPSISVSNIVKVLKGKTSRLTNIEWVTGYICTTK